jgi:hypothetical protein
MTLLKSSDIYNKQKLISEVIGPISQKLWSMTGDEYVDSMSDKAISYFVEGAYFYFVNGNFTMLNSKDWDKAVPAADPTKATYCADEGGICECPDQHSVFYGKGINEGECVSDNTKAFKYGYTCEYFDAYFDSSYYTDRYCSGDYDKDDSIVAKSCCVCGGGFYKDKKLNTSSNYATLERKSGNEV